MGLTGQEAVEPALKYRFFFCRPFCHLSAKGKGQIPNRKEFEMFQHLTGGNQELGKREAKESLKRGETEKNVRIRRWKGLEIMSDHLPFS